jgi:hypothetical protein
VLSAHIHSTDGVDGHPSLTSPVRELSFQLYVYGQRFFLLLRFRDWKTPLVASNLNTTLAHEVGHAGGLDHASADPPAAPNINLMFPNAAPGILQADITIGQVNAWSFIPSQ